MVGSLGRVLMMLVVLFLGGGNSAVYCQEEVPDTVRLKADEFFLEAQRQQLLGNRDAAFELLSHSLELNPYSPAAMYKLSLCYLQLHNDSMAIDLMGRAIKLAPSNYWYHDAMVKLLVQVNRTDDALAQLEEMSVAYPGKTDVLAMLESLYSSKQDWENVIKTLDKIEKIEGKNEQISLEKFRTYILMKDEKNAYEEMVALADEYPNDLRYRVLIGDLLMEDGKTDEALEVYSRVEKEDPENINLMLSMAEYYSVSRQDSLYQQQLEKVITSPNIDDEKQLAFLNNIVVRNIQSGGDTTQVMKIMKKALASSKPSADMYELCLRYMVTTKAPTEDIRPVAQAMLKVNPEHEATRSLLLQYAIEDGDYKEIINVCEPAVGYSVDEPVFYYYLGISYFQTDEYRKSIEVFRSLVSRFRDTDNLEMITNSYSIMGDAYHVLKEDKNAFLAYDTCLIYRPEDPQVLNNYAYYLSLQDKDLKRAEEMSRLSLAKDSANYTYLDTYAWIMFRQKRYQEAKEYIDMALNYMESDSVKASDANIIEHAGDIYSKCGLTDEAVEYWKKALSLNPDSKMLIEPKIKKRKYKE